MPPRSLLYNVIDIGYPAGNSLLWLVDTGLVTLGYLSMANQVAALNIAALPFLFPGEASARAVNGRPARYSGRRADRVRDELSRPRFLREWFTPHLQQRTARAHTG
ncbi:MAG: hypothetical protein CM1200mP36_05470 [Gammaproteobacteria bacterium]|nr:MAG: hypothetical protein CM1200mP36_05470 [Gammaproteobacteria bacterium]